MGMVVNGLVIQVRATAIGTLARKIRARISATSICPGKGKNADIIPI